MENNENINKKISKNAYNGIIFNMTLWLISKKPTYGYEIKKIMDDIFKQPINRDNLKNLSNSQLYPLLHYLEKENLITSEIKPKNGRKTKIYTITEHGQKLLEIRRKRMKELVKTNKIIQEYLDYMLN